MESIVHSRDRWWITCRNTHGKANLQTRTTCKSMLSRLGPIAVDLWLIVLPFHLYVFTLKLSISATVMLNLVAIAKVIQEILAIENPPSSRIRSSLTCTKVPRNCRVLGARPVWLRHWRKGRQSTGRNAYSLTCYLFSKNLRNLKASAVRLEYNAYRFARGYNLILGCRNWTGLGWYLRACRYQSCWYHLDNFKLEGLKFEPGTERGSNNGHCASWKDYEWDLDDLQFGDIYLLLSLGLLEDRQPREKV